MMTQPVSKYLEEHIKNNYDWLNYIILESPYIIESFFNKNHYNPSKYDLDNLTPDQVLEEMYYGHLMSIANLKTKCVNLCPDLGIQKGKGPLGNTQLDDAQEYYALNRQGSNIKELYIVENNVLLSVLDRRAKLIFFHSSLDFLFKNLPEEKFLEIINKNIETIKDIQNTLKTELSTVLSDTITNKILLAIALKMNSSFAVVDSIQKELERVVSKNIQSIIVSEEGHIDENILYNNNLIYKSTIKKNVYDKTRIGINAFNQGRQFAKFLDPAFEELGFEEVTANMSYRANGNISYSFDKKIIPKYFVNENNVYFKLPKRISDKMTLHGLTFVTSGTYSEETAGYTNFYIQTSGCYGTTNQRLVHPHPYVFNTSGYIALKNYNKRLVSMLPSAKSIEEAKRILTAFLKQMEVIEYKDMVNYTNNSELRTTYLGFETVDDEETRQLMKREI